MIICDCTWTPDLFDLNIALITLFSKYFWVSVSAHKFIHFC